MQYQASQQLLLSVKAFKSSNRTTASANPTSAPTLHFLLLLLTWISTDSPSEVHPARRRLRPPHPFSSPAAAHIICFELLGDTSLWRGREKLFKLHKHNVARAPTGCQWWMGEARRKKILPGADDWAALVTEGRRLHGEAWAEHRLSKPDWEPESGLEPKLIRELVSVSGC